VSDADARIVRILDKLARVRQDKKTCFGANEHKFVLNPPLPERAVAQFEAEHGVRLPVAYRSFLTEVGNGGAGPYYGIFPLSKWGDFASWVADDVPPDWLARPCRLVPADSSWGTVAPTDVSDRLGWLDRAGVSRDLIHEAYFGTLALGSQGCTHQMLLVVTGSWPGRIVYVDADHQPPYFVDSPDFLGWYERWLDELLGDYEMSWFGIGMTGTENDFRRVLADPTATAARRIHAADGVLRLPRVDPSTTPYLLGGLHDPIGRVRRASSAAVGRFGLTDGIDQVFGLLGDPDADVRESAIRALAKLACPGWIDGLRSRLDDPSSRVASAALFALHRAGTMTREIALPILSTPSPEMRSLALWAVQWKLDDAPRLLPLLDDESKEVRRYAILALRGADARSAAPQLAARVAIEPEVDILEALAHALGALGEPACALAPLSRLLAHPDDFVQLAAIEALGKLGDSRGAQFIAPFLEMTRKPERRDASGAWVSRTHVKTIAELARPVYERLAKKRSFWRLLRGKG
jgi:HEAT repeat protein